MRKKKIVILGSTGSIGVNALKVVDRYPDRFEILALTAFENCSLLGRQIRKYRPRYAAVEHSCIRELKVSLSGKAPRVFDAGRDLAELAALKDADIIVIAMSGSAALEPFLSAVAAGKQVAPANKEALVIAGEIIMARAEKSGARIVPVDSEQSAIFQCLDGRDKKDLEKISLTASGGRLWDVPASRFDKLTIEDILQHPRWKMGKKITVDSATLMNKGFEVIEAQRLFGVDINKIEVVVHPEAIIHSMVCFRDDSVLAQLGVTDMRLPIQYALSYPERWKTGLAKLDLAKLGRLTFFKPDLQKFPSLSLAYHAGREGGTLPAVLNAADEVAVEAFLGGKIKFTQIYKLVEKVVRKHKKEKSVALNGILQADLWARETARGLIK